MLELKQDIYVGCYEVRVYPYLEEGASDLDIGSSGYVRVLFEGKEEPRIEANIGLGRMSIQDVRTFQSALDKTVEIALRGSHGE